VPDDHAQGAAGDGRVDRVGDEVVVDREHLTVQAEPDVGERRVADGRVEKRQPGDAGIRDSSYSRSI
jgi:hypothetical protein